MLAAMNRKSATGAAAAVVRPRAPAGAKSPAQPARAAPRRAGRRPKPADGTVELSRDVVVARAARIAQQESLDELSMVRLARELGVAPGLIHYYVGNRDALISAIVNLAYRERIEAMPALTGDWRHDLREVARVSLGTMRRWRGVAAYVAAHNRSRLFQRDSGDEVDWGLAFFDHACRILKQGGFTAAQAGMAYHLLMLFLVGVGSAEANRQMPAAHRDFILGYLARPEAADRVGARFVADPFTRIDAEATVEAGLELLLDGFERWRAKPAPGRAPAPRARRATRG